MSIEFYNQNAERFIQDTLNIDMQSLYQRFVEYLPEVALVLDAGCGSGRDSLAFLKMGYSVEAFDASDEMVDYAKLSDQIDKYLRSENNRIIFCEEIIKIFQDKSTTTTN